MKQALNILVFVIVMGLVSGAFLVGVDIYTAPKISKNVEFKLKSAVLDVFGIGYDRFNCLVVFDKNIKTLKKDKYVFYIAPDSAVGFEFHGPGLWGPIHGIISLEKDLKTIREIKITHQEETPGLGGRVAEEEYLEQFKSKEVIPQLVFKPEGKAAQKNEVDAITGATGSSRALEKLLNETIKAYLASLKK